MAINNQNSFIQSFTVRPGADGEPELIDAEEWYIDNCREKHTPNPPQENKMQPLPLAKEQPPKRKRVKKAKPEQKITDAHEADLKDRNIR